MSNTIIVALITGVCGIVSAFIAAYAATKKTSGEMRINQAIMGTKIDALTNEVREHNNFARRIPVIEEQIKTIFRRLDGIERGN